MAAETVHKLTIALAGNPNVGKSTLFNTLTGLRQHTGNWPGKTVGLAQGTVRRGDTLFTLVDLPGTYSLEGRSEEEQIAGEYLREGRADCTVVVCDGSCLERSLLLALQILPQVPKAVVCVNLMDEAERYGLRLDEKALSEALGVPVVLTAAGKKRGLENLLQTVRTVSLSEEKTQRIPWEEPVQAARQITDQCLRGQRDGISFRQKIEKLLVSPRFGMGFLLLLLLLLVWLTVWGANYPAMLLEALFDRGYEILHKAFAGSPDWLSGILLEGVYTTCARVICVMLPPMAIFFPLFTVLEDVGYLPRMAFLLDRPMCRCGGCGKQALTLCMGLGCNAVGVMGCRIIDSPRERVAAILTNAMVPCNGRFPTLILLGSLFFPQTGAALVVAACVALGVTAAMGVCGVLSKTVLRSEPSSFLMEIPPLRRPRLGQILVRSLLDRTLFIAGRALCVAAPAGVLLWILSQLGLLSVLSGWLDPVGQLLGMNGVVLLAFVLSLPANELLIPVILMGLTGGSLREASGMDTQMLLSLHITWQNAICMMAFTLFHWPCSTTVMTVYRETKSIAKTASAILLPTAVGILVCLVLNWIF